MSQSLLQTPYKVLEKSWAYLTSKRLAFHSCKQNLESEHAITECGKSNWNF